MIVKQNILLSLVILLSLTSCSQVSNKPNQQTENLKTDSIMMSEEEWKKRLNEEEYYILREKGTERPFTGKFNLHKEKGIYRCRGCGNELFTDEMKFDSHCGWPSFDREIAGGKIKQTEDRTHGMIRTEITCANCGGHLGHIFEDGPTSTGMRYCVNSVSLSFEPASKIEDKEEVITLGGGCFWCIEAVFQQLKGVKKVESGYSGGKDKNTTYRDVCNGTTGHAEVIQITFNPAICSLENIFKVFFTVHDPTTLNRQGADVGTQYRSVVFYHNERQKTLAEAIIASANKDNIFGNKVVTEVSPFSFFVKAEDYHQNYYNDNKNQPYCRMVIAPKMEKFDKLFSDLK